MKPSLLAVVVAIGVTSSLSSQGEPVGATARCRDGSFSFSSTPCTGRGGVSEVLAADLYLIHPGTGAPLTPTFTALQARTHGGESATVCGLVAGTRYLSTVTGKPTFLDLDQAYPYRVFSIVIWGADRDRFQTPPEDAYNGQRLCVTGRIYSSRGTAYIIVRTPQGIEVGPSPARPSADTVTSH